MIETPWKMTQYGIAAGDYEFSTEACSRIKKGRYPVVKAVFSKFLGDENDAAFLRAWRECLIWGGLKINEEAFALTLKECIRMRSHRFVYRVVQEIYDPGENSLDHDAYFTRWRRTDTMGIEQRTGEILQARSTELKGKRVGQSRYEPYRDEPKTEEEN